MAKATRQAFGEALVRLGEIHSEIVVLDADLSKSTKSDLFAKKFPQRFFEMGIAEANMIGTAAGLSFTGKLPFLCSFGCFLTGRFDTIRLSVAYAQANVRLIGTHAGLGIGDDGYSQMGLEDIALMRALPTMGVFQPMDARETEYLMDYLVKEWKGPAYMRLTRQALPDYYPAGVEFKPLQLLELLSVHEPRVAAIASGAGVSEAMQAAKLLKERGISMSVWSAHALKPFDEEKVKKIASATEWLITVEDHSVIGGLGSCVAEVLAKQSKHPCLKKFGLQDVFGESGDPQELFDKHGFSARAIALEVESLLSVGQ
jgi:transketolase